MANFVNWQKGNYYPAKQRLSWIDKPGMNNYEYQMAEAQFFTQEALTNPEFNKILSLPNV